MKNVRTFKRLLVLIFTMFCAQNAFGVQYFAVPKINNSLNLGILAQRVESVDVSKLNAAQLPSNTANLIAHINNGYRGQKLASLAEKLFEQFNNLRNKTQEQKDLASQLLGQLQSLNITTNNSQIYANSLILATPIVIVTPQAAVTNTTPTVDNGAGLEPIDTPQEVTVAPAPQVTEIQSSVQDSINSSSSSTLTALENPIGAPATIDTNKAKKPGFFRRIWDHINNTNGVDNAAQEIYPGSEEEEESDAIKTAGAPLENYNPNNTEAQEIISAASNLLNETNKTVVPELETPTVGSDSGKTASSDITTTSNIEKKEIAKTLKWYQFWAKHIESQKRAQEEKQQRLAMLQQQYDQKRNEQEQLVQNQGQQSEQAIKLQEELDKLSETTRKHQEIIIKTEKNFRAATTELNKIVREQKSLESALKHPRWTAFKGFTKKMVISGLEFGLLLGSMPLIKEAYNYFSNLDNLSIPSDAQNFHITTIQQQ